MQALLVYYPELTSLLDQRVERKRPAMRWLPLAASLLIAGVAVVQLTSSRGESHQPYVLAAKHELRSVQTRGGETKPPPPYVLPDGEEQYRLAPVLSDPPRNPAYRLELVYLSDEARRVWISGLMQPPFEIVVPHEFLRDGLYQLNILGVDGAHTHLVEQFRFRTPQIRRGGIFSTK